tara:strand:- start:17246 stop:17749 length:504 start_codon:yes stop_codon:yes gene_type:complete
MTNMNAHTYDVDNHKETITESFEAQIPRIRFWTDTGVKTPEISTKGSGGLDLFIDDYAVSNDCIEIKTGLYLEIPKGHVGLLLPRSSTGLKGLRLKNTVGVIDSDYRGEIIIMADRFDDEETVINAGKKIAQLIIVPVCPFPMEQVGHFHDLTVTSRDAGGFGSTGE